MLLTLLLACTQSALIPIDEPGGLSDTGAADGPGGDTAEDTGEPADSGESQGSEDTGDTGESEPCPLPDGALPTAPEGALIGRDGPLYASREVCTRALHAGAGALGSELSLTLSEWSGSGGAVLRVTDLLGQPLAEDAALQPGQSLTFSPSRSGEFLVELAPEDPDEPANTYALSLSCLTGCELLYTRYPLVLFHGMGGTDTYGDGLLDYWYGLEEPLVSAGYDVQIHAVTAWDTVEDRALLWQEVLDGLEAAGVGRRFNLIGHSQGGLDARYLTGALDPASGQDRIASVTTIASPHQGSAVADLFAGLIDEDASWTGWVDLIAEGLGGLIGLSGDDFTAQIADLSTARMAEFNASVPDAPGVSYFSWAGHSCGWLDFTCQEDWGGETVDAYLVLTYAVLAAEEGDNDGMVAVESAKWGEFLGEIPADHLDEVGQLADEDNPAFDHIAFFLAEADRLAGAGH